jgi:hypothetical protein
MSDQVDSDRVDLAEAALAIRKRLALVDEADEKPLPLLALVPKTSAEAEAVKGKVLMWPLGAAAQPTEFGRTGLFKMLPRGSRRFVNNQEIASRTDIKLFFSGEELNVKDETAWMAILRLCRGKPLGERVYFTISALLHELKMKDSGGSKGEVKTVEKKKDGSRALVLARLARLSKAHIKMEITRKNTRSIITTGLMKFGADEFSGKMYARLDPDGAILFDNVAYQNWDVRLALKSDVAVRMLDYICGHQTGKPHFQTIENLRQWFGYGGRPDKFRAACLAGLAELMEAGVIREAVGGTTALRWTRI